MGDRVDERKDKDSAIIRLLFTVFSNLNHIYQYHFKFRSIAVRHTFLPV